MKTFRLYWFFTLLLLLAGCNQKDDVNEIFSSGQTWHWSNSYSTSDWKDVDGRNELHGLCDLLSTCNTAFSALYVSHRSHFTTCLLLISNRLTELLFAFLDCLYKCLLRIIVHHLFLPDCFRNLRISGINEIKQLCLKS